MGDDTLQGVPWVIFFINKHAICDELGDTSLIHLWGIEFYEVLLLFLVKLVEHGRDQTEFLIGLFD